jgi:hypothetical protein
MGLTLIGQVNLYHSITAIANYPKVSYRFLWKGSRNEIAAKNHIAYLNPQVNQVYREYPVAPDRNGNTYDYSSFTAWMESLKSSLGSKGLSVTLPSSYWYMQHFDIKRLEKSVDWFNVSIIRFSRE